MNNPKWSEAEGSEAEGSRHTCTIHGSSCDSIERRLHPMAGYMCAVAWFTGKRCQCGSELPGIMQGEYEGQCRQCINDEDDLRLEDFVDSNNGALASVQGPMPGSRHDDTGDIYESINEGYKRVVSRKIGMRDTNILFNTKIMDGRMKDERGEG